MIEKQDKYFAGELDYGFYIVQSFNGKTIPNTNVIYSSDSSVETIDPEEIPEMEFRFVQDGDIRFDLAQYIIIRFSSQYPLLSKRDNFTDPDKIGVLELCEIDKREWREYLNEPTDSFFEKFKIRS